MNSTIILFYKHSMENDIKQNEINCFKLKNKIFGHIINLK